MTKAMTKRKLKMSDEYTLTLNHPLTEEQWDSITDVDFEHTDRIWFHTKHGKDVEFVKRKQWIPCSERLPEEYEYILLCGREPRPDEDTGYSRMAVGWLQNGRICCWDDRATREDFVAWMPLPDPWEEEQYERTD